MAAHHVEAETHDVDEVSRVDIPALGLDFTALARSALLLAAFPIVVLLLLIIIITVVIASVNSTLSARVALLRSHCRLAPTGLTSFTIVPPH